VTVTSRRSVVFPQHAEVAAECAGEDISRGERGALTNLRLGFHDVRGAQPGRRKGTSLRDEDIRDEGEVVVGTAPFACGAQHLGN